MELNRILAPTSSFLLFFSPITTLTVNKSLSIHAQAQRTNCASYGQKHFSSALAAQGELSDLLKKRATQLSTQLCRGASSTAPINCFTHFVERIKPYRVQYRDSKVIEEGTQLCQGASSLAPADCFFQELVRLSPLGQFTTEAKQKATQLCVGKK